MREVKDLLRSAPQGGLDPTQVADRVGEALRLLAEREVVWVDPEEAKELLGIESGTSIPVWVRLGLLRGRTEPAGGLQVRLDDVLSQRSATEDLLAIPGGELTSEELRILSEGRPGKNPWEREAEPSP